MKITLEQTCVACPEQYDAICDGKIVGFLRLRHGQFSVRCPDAHGDIVYKAKTLGDVTFDTSEREYFLTKAKSTIEKWWARKINPLA